MASTLLLDRTTWDLCKDANGDIAVATDPYSVTQDVSSACRTFVGDLWYDQTKGIPYFTQILAHLPPLPLVKQWLIAQALTVEGCANPTAYFSSFQGRQLSGQIQFTDSNGTTQVATF